MIKKLSENGIKTGLAVIPILPFIVEEKLELAKVLGADHVINGEIGDSVEKIKGLTEGVGADIVIDLVGVAKTIENSISSLRRGGILIIVGYRTELFSVNPRLIAMMNGKPATQGTCLSCGTKMLRIGKS